MVTGSLPLFHGKPVLVIYAADMRNVRNVAAGVAGTVKYATDHHLDAPALIERLIEMGKAYGCVVHVRDYTTEAIELTVTRAERRS